ncbi:MAG: type II secretion system protein [Planctomycetota bacterium]|nr:MAG: type II secretion system protein [Planctomycetota bacterium]
MGKLRNRGFTLVEILVVIGIIVLLASLSYAGIMSAMEYAKRCACISNLRQIGLAALTYAQENDANMFPWAGEDATAVDHLNILIESNAMLTPELFVCPASKGKVPAKEDENGRFILTEKNCTIRCSKVPLSPGDYPKKILLADAHMRGNGDDSFGGHKGGICVYRIGGSCEFVKVKKLPDGWVKP